ncbi:hypothetical protein COY27_06100 [Candidatus Woesearchaeota archaeon CG_4_10_14_0_2_um_filter_33_13]|nr:MAG: hypothetical protein COY27_06100 [Candidatus Woesearchaeota archaeon CG_4_10_14_0_2_um_filter_33_13]
MKTINVVKIVVKNQDKYLLIKRSVLSKFFPSLWDFPGGKIEPKETAEHCAVRETKEETGLTIILDKIIIQDNHLESKVNISYTIFSIKGYDGKVKLSEDHFKFSWLTKEQIISLDLTPFVKRYFTQN